MYKEQGKISQQEKKKKKTYQLVASTVYRQPSALRLIFTQVTCWWTHKLLRKEDTAPANTINSTSFPFPKKIKTPPYSLSEQEIWSYFQTSIHWGKEQLKVTYALLSIQGALNLLIINSEDSRLVRNPRHLTPSTLPKERERRKSLSV